MKRNKMGIGILIFGIFTIGVSTFLYFNNKHESKTSLDTTAPVINIVGNESITIHVGEDYTDPGATAIDEADGNLTTNILIDNNVDTDKPGTYYVTYTVTDDSGNTEIIKRTVIVVLEDKTAPVITILGQNPITIYKGSDYVDAGATAIDDIDGYLTDNIVVNSNVNNNVVGTYHVTYTVTDKALNSKTASRTVNVINKDSSVITIDKTKPVITILGSNPVSIHKGDTYIDSGATATDNIDGNITANITTVSTLNVNTVGTYYITYRVSDKAGNTQTAIRTINVLEQEIVVEEDNVDPVITILGSNPVYVYQGDTYTDSGATATDNIDGNITNDITATSTVNTGAIGSYSVVYSVSDSSNNDVTATRIVEVISAQGYYNFPAPTEPSNCIAIDSASDLNNIRNDLDGIYCLKNDIDMSLYYPWTPIGTSQDKFTGELWGNNYYIKNLSLNTTGSIALFGYVEGAGFNNLKFKDIAINTTGDVAVLVNNMYGNSEINNSKIESTVTISAPSNASGFVSTLFGNLDINNSYADIDISNATNSSPFVGISDGAYELNVAHSTTISTINNNDTFGGFIGNSGAFAVTIANSTANIEGSSISYIGGFIGNSNGNVVINNSSAICDISDAYYQGGFAAFTGSVTISNSSIDGATLTNGVTVGGMVGSSSTTADISNSSIANITIDTGTNGIYAGGMVGDVEGATTFESITLYTIIIVGESADGSYAGGGIAGHVAGAVSGTSIAAYRIYVANTPSISTVGGLIGSSYDIGEFEDVNLSGISLVGKTLGGIAGEIYSTVTFTYIEATDIDVNGETDVAGGLIGFTYAGVTASNVSVRYDINTCTGSCGGIGGTIYGVTLIENSDTAGVIAYLNSGVAGGLVGTMQEDHDINNNTVSINIQHGSSSINGAGGLIGLTYASGSINTATISGSIFTEGYKIGGIIGNNGGTEAISSVNVAVDLAGVSSIGGFIGVSSGPIIITSNTYTGDIVGGTPSIPPMDGGIGGMFGLILASTDITFNSSSSSAHITAGDFVGGIAGVAVSADSLSGLSNLTFNGEISSTGTSVHNDVGLYLQ